MKRWARRKNEVDLWLQINELCVVLNVILEKYSGTNVGSKSSASGLADFADSTFHIVVLVGIWAKFVTWGCLSWDNIGRANFLFSWIISRIYDSCRIETREYQLPHNGHVIVLSFVTCIPFSLPDPLINFQPNFNSNLIIGKKSRRCLGEAHILHLRQTNTHVYPHEVSQVIPLVTFLRFGCLCTTSIDGYSSNWLGSTFWTHHSSWSPKSAQYTMLSKIKEVGKSHLEILSTNTAFSRFFFIISLISFCRFSCTSWTRFLMPICALITLFPPLPPPPTPTAFALIPIPPLDVRSPVSSPDKVEITNWLLNRVHYLSYRTIFPRRDMHLTKSNANTFIHAWAHGLFHLVCHDQKT